MKVIPVISITWLGPTPLSQYKTHRAIEPKCEVITGTKITQGSCDDGDLLKEMIECHEQNTQDSVDTVVGDSKYGTIENFLLCHDLGIKAHTPSFEETHRGSGRQKGIFPKESFVYNPDSDTFTCPGGNTLKRRSYYKKREHYEYKASQKTCSQCHLKGKCTRSKSGRSIKRHARRDDLDLMLKTSKSRQAKRDIKERQHLSERSFARSKRYGYKRARWRGLWRMEIQDFLIATVQNITILIKQTERKISKSNAQVGQIMGDHRPKGRGYSPISLPWRLVRQKLGVYAALYLKGLGQSLSSC